MKKLRLPVFLLALVIFFQSGILTAGAYSPQSDNGKSTVTFDTYERITVYYTDDFSNGFDYNGKPLEIENGELYFGIYKTKYLDGIEVTITGQYESLKEVDLKAADWFRYKISGIVGDITVNVYGCYTGEEDTKDTPAIPDYTENFDISFDVDEYNDYLTVYPTTEAKFGEKYNSNKRYYARNGETGEIDNSGEGELNLAFVNEYPCKWLTLNIEGDYGKIIKTGKFRYRVTNIKSDLRISFDFSRNDIPVTEYNIDFVGVDQNGSIIDLSDFAEIDIYYTLDAESPDEVNAEYGYARDLQTGEISVRPNSAFRFDVRPKESENMSAFYIGWYFKGEDARYNIELKNCITQIKDDVIVVFIFNIQEKKPDKYRVTFLPTEYKQVDVYHSINSETPDEVDVEYGYARNEKTGELDVTGNGVCIFKAAELTVYNDQRYLGMKIYGDYDSLDQDEQTGFCTIRGIKGNLYVDFEYGYYFGEEYMVGDVNSDCRVTSKDSLIIQRYVLGLEKDLKKWEKEAADVDGNDKITNADSLIVLRYTLNLVDKQNTEIGNYRDIIYRY